MEIGKKLQTLRKAKGLTQEELAASLFVSRAAVSKWESGRGYPNIDSLKAIAGYFGVTVDELLNSGGPAHDKGMTVNEPPGADDLQSPCENKASAHAPGFAWLDIAAILFFVLPVFGQAAGGEVQASALISLTAAAPVMRAAYITISAVQAAYGVCLLTIRSLQTKGMLMLSMLISICALALFILGRQPYAALLSLSALIAKAFWGAKRR